MAVADALASAMSDRRRTDKEKLLAGEKLEVWVLDPEPTQRLVSDVTHVLEDWEPRHQSRRQRRIARLVGVAPSGTAVESTVHQQ